MDVIEKTDIYGTDAIVIGVDGWIGTAGINEPCACQQIRPVSIVIEFVDVIKHAERPTDALLGRRRDPELMRKTFGLVAHLIAFVRRIAGAADIAVIGGGIINTFVALIIRDEQPDIRITGIIRLL